MKVSGDNFNTYENGLMPGDLVHARFKFIGVGFKDTVLILKRDLLFTNQTKYGLRSFYKYEGIKSSSSKKIRFRTQDIVVSKVLRPN